MDVVVAALEARGCNPRGNPEKQVEALCPAHEDRNPSLGVKEGHGDCALIFCQTGCSTEEIVAALGLEMTDLFPAKEDPLPVPANTSREPEAEYVYLDAEGAPLFKVVRFPDKRFRQMRFEDGRWKWGLEDVPRVLFHLPEVLKAKAEGRWIFVTEGEKDANAVCLMGEIGTTLPGGAGKWTDAYTETLTGAKVVILADDDEIGRKHAVQVHHALFGKAAQVGVRLAAEGFKDIFDHLAAGKSLNGDLRKAPELLDVPAPTGRSALTARAFASSAGRGSKDWVIGPMFQRGMRTVIGAVTGEGKTTFSMQAVQAMITGEPFLGESKWRGLGESSRALVVDLEQGEETVKARLREAGLDTSDRVDVLWEPSGIALDKRDEDRAMVRDILKDGGYDLVLLDPLYQLHLGSGNDEAVAAETMRIVDGWAREFNCSLVIPMHARKPHPEAGKNFTIHDIAGVGTWLRNAEFIFGLQLIAPKLSRVWTFKDRVGNGPEIRSSWWLDFHRSEGGFKRNYKEQRDAIKRSLKSLLMRDEGASKEELLTVPGSDDLMVQEALQRTHRREDRYRTKRWPGQAVAADQTALDVAAE